MKINLNNSSIKNYEYKNDELNIPSKGKIEYVLECGVIKVYIIDGKNQRKCIKSIPVKLASKELLAMVKCQTIADTLYIKDLMESGDDSDKKVSEDDSNTKDDLMDNYDSIPYLRGRYILSKEHGKSKLSW